MKETTITLKGGALEVRFAYSPDAVVQVKRLAPGTRSWDGTSKCWVVDSMCFEEVIELFPDASVHPDVWAHCYPTFGKRVPEVVELCRRWADSGIVLLRDGDGLIAHHDHTSPADLAALQVHVDEVASDINALLLAGVKVPGVLAAPQAEEGDEKLLAFMQMIRTHRATWEKNATKKRMMAKGWYGK